MRVFAFPEFAVLLKDVFMGGTLVRNIGVVAAAQDIGSAVQGVVANPPTTLCVAVHLTDTGVHPDADSTDDGRLAKVRAEAGPEVVVHVWPAVEYAGVKRQPMPYDIEEGKEEGDSHDEDKEEKAESQPPRYGATTLGRGVGSRAAAST